MKHNRSTSSPGRARARLTKAQAVSIFQSKSPPPSAARIAVSYGVSEKAIRDIWKRRTWARETMHLDPPQALQQKAVGRPKGSRDSKPRKRKVDTIPHPLALPSTGLPTDCVAQATNNLMTKSDACCNQQEDLDRQGAWFTQTHLVQSNTPIKGIGEHLRGDSASFSSSSYASHCSSVDEQLGEWDATIWSNPKDADPFRQDWTPMSCE